MKINENLIYQLIFHGSVSTRRQKLNQLDPYSLNGALNFAAAFYSQCQELTFAIHSFTLLLH